MRGKRAALDAIEVGIEGYGDLGRLFSPAALDLWDKLQVRWRVAGVGGQRGLLCLVAAPAPRIASDDNGA